MLDKGFLLGVLDLGWLPVGALQLDLGLLGVVFRERAVPVGGLVGPPDKGLVGDLDLPLRLPLGFSAS